MAENSKIEWTDHTFNPWIGCTKVSPACDGCYAENLMANRYHRVEWGAGEDRKRTSDSNWRKPLAWNKVAAGKTKPTFVFCASLADVFDNEVDPLWRDDLFRLIERTPNLTWLLLTKRIGNVMKMTDPMRDGRPLPQNVAVGATIANQEEYDRDRMKLWQVKADREPLFTFGSFEPLLGPVILDKHAPDGDYPELDKGRSKPLLRWVAGLFLVLAAGPLSVGVSHAEIVGTHADFTEPFLVRSAEISGRENSFAGNSQKSFYAVREISQAVDNADGIAIKVALDFIRPIHRADYDFLVRKDNLLVGAPVTWLGKRQGEFFWNIGAWKHEFSTSRGYSNFSFESGGFSNVSSHNRKRYVAITGVDDWFIDQNPRPLIDGKVLFADSVCFDGGDSASISSLSGVGGIFHASAHVKQLPEEQSSLNASDGGQYASKENGSVRRKPVPREWLWLVGGLYFFGLLIGGGLGWMVTR